MLKSRLKLGTFFGIRLYVHWTFALLVGFVAFSAREAGWVGVLYGVLQLLGVFTCVTLHEYGHALTARRFGVPTVDITLLPIGGVARLQRMPRVPWQELLVAVAGPAVNVVIVAALSFGLAVYGGTQLVRGVADAGTLLETVNLALTEASILGFVLTMLIVNTMLVLFNMIPAFPMDGGRVLRSVLAMLMEYRRATFIASRIGLGCAVLMGLVALQFQAFIPILIAAFIGYAGIAEARQVDVMESLRGLTVRGAMLRNPPAVTMDTPLWELARRWRSTPGTGMPVLSIADTVIGMVWLRDISEWIGQGVDPMTPAGQLADHDVPTVSIEDDLESVVASSGGKYRQMPVVDAYGRLLGLLDLDCLVHRGRLPQEPDSCDSESPRLNVLS